MRLPVVLVLLAVLVDSNSTQAQEGVGTTICSYDECALRQEGQLLIRGSRGTPVGKLGAIKVPRLVPLIGDRAGVAPSADSALAYARVFDREYPRGIAIGWTGTIAAAIPLAIVYRRLEDGAGADAADWGWVAATVPGLALQYWGARKVQRARSALGKAIWWHNRDLAR